MHVLPVRLAVMMKIACEIQDDVKRSACDDVYRVYVYTVNASLSSSGFICIPAAAAAVAPTCSAGRVANIALRIYSVTCIRFADTARDWL